jgi:hypothetical protein
MKIAKMIFAVMMLCTQVALSNNIQVSNVRLTDQDTTEDFTMVEFDISWENSWRYNGGPNNWDAAWVFVKYRIGVAGEWRHAWLNDSGHITDSWAILENGLLTPGAPFNGTTNPVLGGFLYRNAPGAGSFSAGALSADGALNRGGSYADTNIEEERLSDRRFASVSLTWENAAHGGRGCRTE